VFDFVGHNKVGVGDVEGLAVLEVKFATLLAVFRSDTPSSASDRAISAKIANCSAVNRANDFPVTRSRSLNTFMRAFAVAMRSFYEHTYAIVK
jgi:hypothetical protein